MPKPRMSKLDSPFGWFRQSFVQDIGTDDYEDENGFACRALTAGDYTWRDSESDADEGPTMIAAGEYLGGMGAVPVTLLAVRANSANSSVRIGYA